MDDHSIFERVFEDQAVRAPVLTISHDSDIAGWRGHVCHTVSEVVYNAFDKALAAYVHATGRATLPRARVETVLLDEQGAIRRSAAVGCRSVLDALIQIGEVAARAAGRDFLVSRGDRARHLRDAAALRPVRLDAGQFEVMAAAADLLAEIADPGLSRITATLDGVTVQPPAGGPAFCEIDLARALVTFPAGAEGEAIRVPLAGFRVAAAEGAALRARLRRMQEALAAARQAAVDDFGAACDREVTRLQRALAGRPVEGRAAEVAGELIDRLVAAFGPDLRGLSPHARLIALDWIEKGIALKLIARVDAA
ncbi:MAG: hypothetical protein D6686_13540 [Alphaproteobacteria bacterium]|nr:MAG: hypothetical protein D6686_13540 [Alphaproteobacteria bacterium]